MATGQPLATGLRRKLHASLTESLDIWLRLRRWVRWLCGMLVVLAAALLALWWLNRRPPAPLPTISVKLAGPPALPSASQPVDPAQLAALLTDRTPLKPAPFEALTVATPDGMLPRKAAGSGDVLTPLQAYSHAQAAVPPGTKQLAVIVLELGLGDRLTQPALALPSAVTLAYDATAAALPEQIDAARAAGHEVALDIPAEPKTYPLDDPGPETLLAGLPPRQLLRQLHGFMARSPGAALLLTRSGSYFTTQSAALWPVLQDLSLRGLGWVDVSAADGDLSMAVAAKLGVPAAGAAIVLDEQPDEAGVRAQFESALAQLDKTNRALIVAHAYPATLGLLDRLLQTLPEHGVALVPASQLLKVAPQ